MSRAPPSSYRHPGNDGFQTVTSRSSRRYSKNNLVEDLNRSRGVHADSWRNPGDGDGALASKMKGMEVSPMGRLRAGSRVGSVVSCTEKGRTDTGPKDYRLGMLIRVPHVVPSLDPTATYGDRHVAMIDNTGPVIGKMRPAIVVGIFKSNLLCIPVKTSGGRGCPPEKAGQCVLLRALSDHSSFWDNVLECKYLVCEPGYNSKEGAYIIPSEVFSISYLCPIVFLGRLSEKSCRRVQILWRLTVVTGFQPVGLQEEFFWEQAEEIPREQDYEKTRKQYASFVDVVARRGSVYRR